MREAYLSGGITPDEQPAAPAAPQEISLTKIKLDGMGLYVEYTTGEADGGAKMTALHKRPVHLDLLTALDHLVPHLALMCDLVQGVRDEDVFVPADDLFSGILDVNSLPLHERPEFKALKVTGITYSTTGVVLIGQKRYRGGKVLNLITPHEVLEPEQETGMEYLHLWELGMDLHRVEQEAHAYLAGKTGSAPPEAVQGELEFEGEEKKETFGEFIDNLSKRVDSVAKQHKARKAAGYTVTVGKGADAHELGKGKKGKDAAAGKD